MRSLISFILLSLMVLPSYAQNSDGPGGKMPGYDIKVVADEIDAPVLYLVGYYGYEYYKFDSAKVKAHTTARFVSKKKYMPDGLYALTFSNMMPVTFLVIEHSRVFTVKCHKLDETFPLTSSVEGSDENAALFQFDRAMMNPESDTRQLALTVYESMPESLLGMYLKYIYCLNPSALKAFERNDTTLLSDRQVMEWSLDAYNYNDVRMLFSGYGLSLKQFFWETLPQDGDTLFYQADRILKRFTEQESYEFYLNEMLSVFDRGINNVEYDKALVLLFDAHCKDKTFATLSPDLMKYYARTVEYKRRLLIGTPVPPLVCPGANGITVASTSVKKPFVLLWFWDPDCDDCVELTPKLHDLYVEYGDTYGFEVYAVGMTDDVEKWNLFVLKNQLSWINVCPSIEDSNYDYFDYFNIITTPVLFVLDNQHTIIARPSSLDDLLSWLIDHQK